MIFTPSSMSLSYIKVTLWYGAITISTLRTLASIAHILELASCTFGAVFAKSHRGTVGSRIILYVELPIRATIVHGPDLKRHNLCNVPLICHRQHIIGRCGWRMGTSRNICAISLYHPSSSLLCHDILILDLPAATPVQDDFVGVLLRQRWYVVRDHLAHTPLIYRSQPRPRLSSRSSRALRLEARPPRSSTYRPL